MIFESKRCETDRGAEQSHTIDSIQKYRDDTNGWPIRDTVTFSARSSCNRIRKRGDKKEKTNENTGDSSVRAKEAVVYFISRVLIR